MDCRADTCAESRRKRSREAIPRFREISSTRFSPIEFLIIPRRSLSSPRGGRRAEGEEDASVRALTGCDSAGEDGCGEGSKFGDYRIDRNGKSCLAPVPIRAPAARI